MNKTTLAVLLLLSGGFSWSQQAGTRSATAAIEPVVLGQSVVALNGAWKFHVGDDPRWAAPDFDDSSWETMDLTPKTGSFDPTVGFAGYVPGWTAHGHPGYWGYAWYRLRVRVNAGPGERLALAGPLDFDDAYQVFANGSLLGSFGIFPSDGRPPAIFSSQPVMFDLPRIAREDSTEMVLAFRFWMAPSTLQVDPDAGGMHDAPLVGERGAIAAGHQLAWLNLIRGYASSALLACLFVLLACIACSLMLFDPADSAYRWLAAVFLLIAINSANLCVLSWTQMESALLEIILPVIVLLPLTAGAWAMVWWAWFRLRRPAWMPKAVAALTLFYILSQTLGSDIFFAAIPHQVSAAFYLVSAGINVIFLLLFIFLAIQGTREQGREALLALPALVLVGISQFQFELRVLHIRTLWFPLGTQLSLSTIADLLISAVIFVLLIRRLLLSVRHQRQIALDVKQAQEVQQVILPEPLISVPGFAMESEYRPALEVGGDFFQIIPRAEDGSVLIVAGDVAGKGLKAGMLVAVLVGAIRSTAELNPDPKFLLEALNRRLIGRGEAHATCLAMRITAAGNVTLANAGHLPPYLNGRELPVEGSLPLGLHLGFEPSVMSFELQPDDRLVLVSDGVAEAQDEHGQLFGFERIRELLAQEDRSAPMTASALADAAQRFGQQDDISVIAVTRVAVMEASAA